MLHKHTVEKHQNRPIQISMCPKDGWLSVMAALELANYSSIEMKIVNSRRRAIASDYEEFLH